MGRWLALALLVSTAAIADTPKQPDQPKAPVCKFPDRVQIVVSVTTADTIAIALSGGEHGYNQHLEAQKEWTDQLRLLRNQYCK